MEYHSVSPSLVFHPTHGLYASAPTTRRSGGVAIFPGGQDAATACGLAYASATSNRILQALTPMREPTEFSSI